MWALFSPEILQAGAVMGLKELSHKHMNTNYGHKKAKQAPHPHTNPLVNYLPMA